MIDTLNPVSAAPIPCKICGNEAMLYGVVDFHKCCEELRGIRLPLSGIPIYYRRCATCDFLFTDAFDCWSNDQFKAHIYNEGYSTVDPDYQSVRPRANADTVLRLFGKHRAELRVLDFGGGNDAFCNTLRLNGFPVAITYDPMTSEYAHRPDGKFELVTCFETLEHMTAPAIGIALMVESLAEQGLVLFSTLVQPEDFNNLGLNWWYVGPRNGHISIFSLRALELVWRRQAYKLASFNKNLHIAFRVLPSFAAHLIKK
jgi:2-polyprenyl-6-hydroxyphenyl methylase/3-demethylubiquinone-9 3-methyltransferase